MKKNIIVCGLMIGLSIGFYAIGNIVYNDNPFGEDIHEIVVKKSSVESLKPTVSQDDSLDISGWQTSDYQKNLQNAQTPEKKIMVDDWLHQSDSTENVLSMPLSKKNTSRRERTKKSEDIVSKAKTKNQLKIVSPPIDSRVEQQSNWLDESKSSVDQSTWLEQTNLPVAELTNQTDELDFIQQLHRDIAQDKKEREQKNISESYNQKKEKKSNSSKQDQQETLYAQKLINRAFNTVDQMKKENKQRTDVMITALNNAFDTLSQSIQGTNLQPIKDAAIQAISFFGTQSPNNAGDWMPKIIDATKLALTAPIKLAVRVTAAGVGAVGGAVYGVRGGLKVGIEKTQKEISDLNTSHELDTTILEAAKLMPEKIIIMLKGVVTTTALVAYKTAQGAVAGARAGNQFAEENITGKFMSLKDNALAENTLIISNDNYNNDYNLYDVYKVPKINKSNNELSGNNLYPEMKQNNVFDNPEFDFLMKHEAFAEQKAPDAWIANAEQVKQKEIAQKAVAKEKAREIEMLRVERQL